MGDVTGPKLGHANTYKVWVRANSVYRKADYFPTDSTVQNGIGFYGVQDGSKRLS